MHKAAEQLLAKHLGGRYKSLTEAVEQKLEKEHLCASDEAYLKLRDSSA